MKIEMQRRHWLALALGILLLIAFIVYQYVVSVQPVQSEKNRLEEEITTLERKLGETERESAAAGEKQVSLFTIQQQLPLQPRIDDVLLELDKAEELSGSYILSAERLAPGERPVLEDTEESTGNKEDSEEGQVEADNNQELTFDQQEGELNVEQEQEEESGEPVIRNGGEADAVSYMLRVRTPEYSNLIDFVEAVDSSMRLINVDTLSFEGRAEQVWEEQEQNPLTVTMIISAFYYPETEELENIPPSSGFDAPEGNNNPIHE